LLWFIVLAFVAGICEHQAFAQIPNPGFESWTAGDPDNWNTSNTPGAINVTQVSGSHSGASAVQGAVISFVGFPWPPVIISGTDAEGFPVNTQHAAVHGWYRFTPTSGDQLFVTGVMTNADSGVGGGAFITSTAQSTYREFVANIVYFSPQVPDTCNIGMTITGPGGGLPHVGSIFVVDDLAFGPAVAVDESGNVLPASFELSQNYPNPFNPATLITYSLPRASQVQLKVFNTLGQEVAVLVDAQQDAGVYRTEFDGTHLPSGTYFYRLTAGEFSQGKKLLLVK
ncbi:MAG: T9SS type A sorting domain-containing protein, partial [Bacteroidota bacterium]